MLQLQQTMQRLLDTKDTRFAFYVHLQIFHHKNVYFCV